MKLGLGLYRHMLTAENYAFARQAGATHIVAHLVDYFSGNPTKNHGDKHDQPTGGSSGWGLAGDPDHLWSVEELVQLRIAIESAGLQLAAIENLDPAHWHDVLLDGPRRDEQIENVKTIIRNLGQAGIPALGYNFSLAGVASRSSKPYARGGAISVGMETVDQSPIPSGMVWNMVYDSSAASGVQHETNHAQLWDRVRRFLGEVVPVAEQSGVALAAHPDDPPVAVLRGSPRLVYQPRFYDQLLALDDSPANGLEFCIGSLAEMTEGDIYEVVDHFAASGRIVYVHFRNVRGKVPTYHETFVDDGDVDMLRVVGILRDRGFDGVLIPDHTPQLACAAPWHAGMAYAMGFMKAALRSAE